MSRFISKSWGRIFVADASKIADVEAIAKELDEFENSYLPTGFIAAWGGDIGAVTYGHKFEIDIDALTEKCWNAGIWIACVTGKKDPLATY